MRNLKNIYNLIRPDKVAIKGENMREIGGSVKYFKYAECNEGDVLIEQGKYLETSEGKFGPQHKFMESKSRETKVLNSAGQLNFLIDQIETGDFVKVIYKGKVKLEKGAMAGKEAHNFQMFDVSDEVTTPKTETKPLNLDELA